MYIYVCVYIYIYNILIYIYIYKHCGTRWCRGMFCASQVRIYLKPLRSDLGQVGQWSPIIVCEERNKKPPHSTRTSLVSSPGGVKASELAFGQRTIIIIILRYIQLHHWYKWFQSGILINFVTLQQVCIKEGNIWNRYQWPKEHASKGIFLKFN